MRETEVGWESSPGLFGLASYYHARVLALDGLMGGRRGGEVEASRTCAHVCKHVRATTGATAFRHPGPDASERASRAVANEERKRFINAPRGRSLVVTVRWLSESRGEKSVDKLARGRNKK